MKKITRIINDEEVIVEVPDDYILTGGEVDYVETAETQEAEVAEKTSEAEEDLDVPPEEPVRDEE